MTNWEDLTDSERDALNEEAYAICADLLRRAEEQFPGCELDEYKRYVGEQLAADIAANNADIKRATRSRATKWDKISAASARTRNEGLHLQQGMLWDVEP